MNTPKEFILNSYSKFCVKSVERPALKVVMIVLCSHQKLLVMYIPLPTIIRAQVRIIDGLNY